MFFRITLLIVVAVGMVACRNKNVDAQFNDQGGLDIAVTFTEAELNTMFSSSIANNPNADLRSVSVDLQPGQFVLSGEFEREDGSGEWGNGTITVQVSLVEGDISVQLANLNIDGWAADDSRITLINQQIEQALQGGAMRDNPDVNITVVNITDDSLSFTVHTTGENRNN